MDFEDNVALDTSQVSDTRGRSFPGGGVAIGGGAGILGLVVALLLGVNPFTSSSPDAQTYTTSDIAQRCQTGADADRDVDCRVVGVVNSVQAYWSRALGSRYRESNTRLFTGATSTGCGNATSDVGPFYCPADKTVYLDLGFFGDLKSKFGASGGPFAQAYVVAHEYGHHVQDLQGFMDRASQGSGATGGSVRLELQADCYAGVWAANAVATGFITRLTDADVADGLDAAAAVGDDRIQEEFQGRVTPESWTHGSSEQRQRWFTTGYRSGSAESCDTFSARTL
jgi:predicted metalloprotease